MSKIAYDLNEIRAIVFDVDGVLSPSTVLMGRDGVPRRMVNLKDGYAIQFAARNGLKMAIITGADSAGIIKQYIGYKRCVYPGFDETSRAPAVDDG